MVPTLLGTEASTTTSNVRTAGASGVPGVAVDLDVTLADGATRRGMGAVYEYESKRYVILFLAVPERFDALGDEVQSILDSPSPVLRTIGF